jgi:hypothetical protein
VSAKHDTRPREINAKAIVFIEFKPTINLARPPLQTPDKSLYFNILSPYIQPSSQQLLTPEFSLIHCPSLPHPKMNRSTY